MPDLQPLPQPIRIADVRTREVDWLWPRRIPIGKITLLVGDPGVGKSLVTLDIAARVSRGTPFPDATPNFASSATTNSLNTPPNTTPTTSPPHDPHLPISTPPAPSSVLLLSAEDDLADTIRPRLEALGADCAVGSLNFSSRSAGWPSALGPSHSAVTFLDHVLESLPDCRLVIVDPISAYLGGAVENINSEVRRIIAPLAELAARRRLALLAVSHLRKQQGAAIHRTMGSLAFIAAARATWLIAKDPNAANRRLMLPLKNNFAADTNGLAFSILPLPLGEGRGEGGERRGEGAAGTSKSSGQPIIHWSPEPIDVAADVALASLKRTTGRPSDERDEAARWLREQLAAGVRPFADIEAVATANGFKLPTLRRAFRAIGGEAVRVDFGPLGEWFWRLPGIGDQKPQPTFADLWTERPESTARTETAI